MRTRRFGITVLYSLAVMILAGCSSHNKVDESQPSNPWHTNNGPPPHYGAVIPNIERKHKIGANESPYLETFGFASHYEIQAYYKWAEQHHLNEYGDPQGTRYALGSPLYLPHNRHSIKLYDYLIKKFPSRPWQPD